jgi:hypothetical protein
MHTLGGALHSQRNFFRIEVKQFYKVQKHIEYLFISNQIRHKL